MNATEPKRRVAGPRLALMLILFLVAGGATWIVQAQPAPGGGEAEPTNEQPAGQPTSVAPQPVAPSAPETTDAAAIVLSEQPLYRVKQLFMFSPVINGIILGLSILGVLFFAIFMLTINRRTMVPSGFVDEVVKLVVRGDYERAGDVCRRARGVFAADIIQRCLENHSREHSVMLDMIDTEGRRLADIIWNRVSYLADISNVAPMLGLLGTVLGMIKAFYGLQHETGTIDALTLSRGVGEAMSTTLFGLGVGILTLVLYSFVKSRATRTLADAEQAVHMIADHIKRDDAMITTGNVSRPRSATD